MTVSLLIGENDQLNIDYYVEGDADGFTNLSLTKNFAGGDPSYSSLSNVNAPYLNTSGVLGVKGAALADFNGDGNLDFAVATAAGSAYGVTSTNSVTIYTGDGQGGFTAAGTFGTGGITPDYIATADFNGDGRPDLVVAGDDYVTVLLSHGDNSFTSRIVEVDGSSIAGLAVGDLNGDGRPDIAVTNAFSNTVSILLNQGAGFFTEKNQILAGATDPVAIAIGDLNNDGRNDIAVGYGSGYLDNNGNFQGPGYGYAVLTNSANNGTFSVALNNGELPAISLAIANDQLIRFNSFSEYNAPGNPQQLPPVTYGADIDVNGPDGELDAQVLVFPPYYSPLGGFIQLADVNNDGLFDIISPIGAFLNIGTSSKFASSGSMLNTSIPDGYVGNFDTAFAVNRNGLLTFPAGTDRALEVSDPDSIGLSTTETLVLTVEHGTLTANLPGLGGGISGSGTSQLTLQGYASAINSSLASMIYTPSTDYVGSDAIYLSVLQNFGSAQTSSLIINLNIVKPATHSGFNADYDGGGNSDLMLLDPVARQLQEWQMNGNAIAQNLGVQTIASGWRAIGSGDFDGDGNADLLWQNGTQLAEWQMNGAAVGASLSLPDIAAGWTAVAVGDFNVDGKSDLLWENRTTGELAEWQMNGGTRTADLAVQSIAPGYTLAAAGDFDGDGTTDLLWLNPLTGSLVEWQMNGANVTSDLAVQSLPTGWTILGTGDFNGDGNADLLMENKTTNALAEWQMNGATVVAKPAVQSIASGWVLDQIGDFNGDGMSDILWRNTATGELAQWQMDGTTVKNSLAVPALPQGSINILGPQSSVPRNDFNADGSSDILWKNGSQLAEWQMSGNTVSQNLAVQSIASGWTAVGVADFNGDGSTDILWQNGSQLAQWQMNGNTVSQNLSVQSIASGWTLAATGDFDGDGKADLLWQNGSQLAEWQMNGNTVTQNLSVQSIASGWTLVGSGDFDGDGKTDLLWQNGSQLVEWQMNGNTVTQNLSVQNIASGWSLAGVGDFNGDGKADLLWKNGSQLVEWQMNGNTVSQSLSVQSIASGWTLAQVGDFNADGLSDLLWQNGSQLAQWQMSGATVTQNLAVQSIASGYAAIAMPTMG